jgi:hypothetical protein
MPQAAAHAVHGPAEDLAHRAVVDPLDRFHPAQVVTVVEAHDDVEPLLLGLLGGAPDRPAAHRVRGDRLLGEHVETAADGLGEVQGPEAGRRGQDHVVELEAHQLLVGLGPDEGGVLGDFDPLLERFVLQVPMPAKSVEALHDAVRGDLGHPDDLGRGIRSEGVGAGAGTATAGAHDADLEHRLPGLTRAYEGKARREGGRGHGSRGDEVPA